MLIRDEMLMFYWLASTSQDLIRKMIPKLVWIGEHYWVGAVLVLG